MAMIQGTTNTPSGITRSAAHQGDRPIRLKMMIVGGSKMASITAAGTSATASSFTPPQ